MSRSLSLLSLDVGEKRIGTALADTAVRIAVPYDTIIVDGTELEQIAKLIGLESVDIVVIGYPRNQSGEATAQTAYAEAFAEKLEGMAAIIVFQVE